MIMTPYLACWAVRSGKASKSLPELEDIIMTDKCESCLYAKYVIKGKLPEKMHNMMLLHAIKDPDNHYVKSYFEFIK